MTLPPNPPPTSDHDLLVELRTLVSQFISSQNDHERRIRVLEEWKWKVIGEAAAVSAALGIGAALLGHYVIH